MNITHNYLKSRNYTIADKFKKSDLALTENASEFIFNRMIDGDISRSNSFLFSNVLCLTNHQNLVEQQFTKFTQFVQSQEENIKDELSTLFGPIICHLYIELLKGREWKPACDFLRNHAHLIASIENLNAPLTSTDNEIPVDSSSSNLNEEQLPSNSGNNSNSNLNNENNESSSTEYPTATTRILYVNESTGNLIKDYFKDMIQILSTFHKYELLGNIQSVITLRSSKFEIEVSYEAVKCLINFLEKQGHVVILNILHTWVQLTIKDLQDIDEDEALNIENDLESYLLYGSKLVNSEKTDQSTNRIQFKKKLPTNLYSRNLATTMMMLQKLNLPTRSIKIIDADRNLVSACMDKKECHVVGAFANSLVKLWQLNGNVSLGRNPYERFGNQDCDWVAGNQYKLKFDEEEEKERLNPSAMKKIEKFYADKCEDNSFDEYGGIFLRGHSRGVTDCAFSKKYPLLFTSSKDCTMRAWKAEDYTCGLVYRGHNYPVWCLSESPVGYYLASGSRDLTARLWHIENEYPLITYVGHTQDVECVAFHPNGNYLATASCDLSVRLWSVTSGNFLRVFTECRLPITCIAFSPNGKYLAAGGEENVIRIFDLATSTQLTQLSDHTSTILHFVWNKNETKIASCCQDGSIRIWNIATNFADGNHSFIIINVSQFYSGFYRPVKIYFNSNDILTIIGSAKPPAVNITKKKPSKNS